MKLQNDSLRRSKNQRMLSSIDVRCLFDFRILSDFDLHNLLNRKENHGCVASGAYRYRKITLPGNPKARLVRSVPSVIQSCPTFLKIFA